jgi:HSP20 family protein
VSVLRYDSFRDFDRLAAQLLGGAAGASGGPRSFPMDAYRRGDRFFVHLDLPGVDPRSIDLTCEQNVLTVQAERRFETREEDQLVVNERAQGTFSRQLFLSDNLDLDRIEANYENGVLTLQLPVAEQAKPRRIEVSTSSPGPQVIEGTSERSD